MMMLIDQHQQTFNNFMFFIIVLLMFFFGYGFAMAASLEINPDIIKIVANNDENRMMTVEVINHSTHPYDFTVEPEYWSPASLSLPLESWMTIHPKHLELKPGNRGRLHINVEFPETEKVEIVCMIYLANKLQTGSLSIQARYGFPVYMRRDKHIIKKAAIKKMKIVQDKNYLKIQFKLINQGNSHLVPFGAILLKQKKNIMAQQEVMFTEPVFPDKAIEHTVSIAKNKLPPGDYQAHLQLCLNDIYGDRLGNQLPVINEICQVQVVPDDELISKKNKNKLQR